MAKGIFQMPLKLLINWFLLNHQVDYVFIAWIMVYMKTFQFSITNESFKSREYSLADIRRYSQIWEGFGVSLLTWRWKKHLVRYMHGPMEINRGPWLMASSKRESSVWKPLEFNLTSILNEGESDWPDFSHVKTFSITENPALSCLDFTV